jgi:hypothetical protein
MFMTTAAWTMTIPVFVIPESDSRSEPQHSFISLLWRLSSSLIGGGDGARARSGLARTIFPVAVPFWLGRYRSQITLRQNAIANPAFT